MPEETLRVLSPDNINKAGSQLQRKKPEQVIVFSLMPPFL